MCTFILTPKHTFMMQSMYDLDLTIEMLAGQAENYWPKHARTVEP